MNLTRLVKVFKNKIANSLPARLLSRGAVLARYWTASVMQGLRWLPKRTETSNFYYELSPRNLADLGSTLAFVFATEPKTFESYFEELLEDVDLRDHLMKWARRTGSLNDSTMAVGRRVVWYAIVRHTRPQLVVETGVYHGVGACVLASALRRNAEAGHPGRYLGTEINPSFGSAFSGTYREYGEIVYGDSISTLSNIDRPIDLFINDSDHRGGYEREEYLTVEGLLSTGAVVIGDNAHVSPELNKWSRKLGRPYVFMPEVPKDHWYKGAGVGLSLPEKHR